MTQEIPDWLKKSRAIQEEDELRKAKAGIVSEANVYLQREQEKERRFKEIAVVTDPIKNTIKLWENLGLNDIIKDVNMFFKGNSVSDLNIHFDKPLWHGGNFIYLRSDGVYCYDSVPYPQRDRDLTALLYDLPIDVSKLNWTEITKSSLNVWDETENADGMLLTTTRSVPIFSISMRHDGIWALSDRYNINSMIQKYEGATSNSLKSSIDTLISTNISKR